MSQLLLTPRWIRTVESEAKARVLAPKLWVSPRALLEARRRHDEAARARGLQPIKGRKRAGTEHPQIDILLPRGIWEEWLDWCESRALESPTALRSLLHAYLLSGREPKLVKASKWVYRGKVLPVSRECREKALMSPGAYRALSRRAARLNVTRSAICRALILEALEGRIRHVLPVDARTMWDDPDKYWKP